MMSGEKNSYHPQPRTTRMLLEKKAIRAGHGASEENPIGYELLSRKNVALI